MCQTLCWIFKCHNLNYPIAFIIHILLMNILRPKGL